MMNINLLYIIFYIRILCVIGLMMLLYLKHIFSLKKIGWLISTTISKIKFNLGDIIKDENNLQSIKLKIKEELKNNYGNLFF